MNKNYKKNKNKNKKKEKTIINSLFEHILAIKSLWWRIICWNVYDESCCVTDVICVLLKNRTKQEYTIYRYRQTFHVVSFMNALCCIVVAENLRNAELCDILERLCAIFDEYSELNLRVCVYTNIRDF